MQLSDGFTKTCELESLVLIKLVCLSCHKGSLREDPLNKTGSLSRMTAGISQPPVQS